MSEESKPQATRGWSVSALIISVVVAGLLGLSAGSNLDKNVSPTLGETGAAVVGIVTALFVWVCVGSVFYRGLTR